MVTIQAFGVNPVPGALSVLEKSPSTPARIAPDAFVKSPPRESKMAAPQPKPLGRVSTPKVQAGPRPAPKAPSKGGASKQKMARFAVRSKNGLNRPNKAARCKSKDFLGQRASWSPSVRKLRKVLSRQALAAASSPSLMAVAAWLDREDFTPSRSSTEPECLGYLVYQPRN